MPEIVCGMPFDTSRNEIVIAQGFDAPISHRVINDFVDLRYAVDFALPVGTEVLAVRDGVVYVFEGDPNSCYCGSDPEAGRKIPAPPNIIVKHDDIGGSPIYSMMQHLDAGSFVVKSGTRVTRGQVLAVTGLTGWVGPVPHLHLHFHHNMGIKTVPYRLEGCDWPLDDRNVVERLRTSESERCREIFEARRVNGFA